MRFETVAIHAGQKPDAATGAVMTPIYQTSTFAFEAAGKPRQDMYSRVSNPTRTALETNLAALEQGKHGFAFSTGLAAETTLLELLSTGDTIVVHNDLYGGTYRLLSQLASGRGIRVEYVDVNRRAEFEAALRIKPRFVWIETPTNPLMTLIDIRETARLTHESGAKLIVDNTFLSPYFQNPLQLGADVVLHSLTKYINGHSDVLGGALITDDDAIAERLKFFQKSLGTNATPFDSFLILRGIKTLAVRMETHHRNALELARYLETQPQIENVLHPGLESHPQYGLAADQMRGFGGTFSFRLKGGEAEVNRFLDGLEVITLAESLGGVESLIEHPWSMTHASIPDDMKLSVGLTPNLIRFSVGIEHVEDLREDLNKALRLLV